MVEYKIIVCKMKNCFVNFQMKVQNLQNYSKLYVCIYSNPAVCYPEPCVSGGSVIGGAAPYLIGTDLIMSTSVLWGEGVEGCMGRRVVSAYVTLVDDDVCSDISEYPPILQTLWGDGGPHRMWKEHYITHQFSFKVRLFQMGCNEKIEAGVVIDLPGFFK